jgi:hypothetical protein
MAGVNIDVPSEEQVNNGWTLIVRKQPTYKGYLVFGYKDFMAPAMSVYKKGNKIRKIYTYSNTIDINQSVLSVAKEIFMQQEAYRLLQTIEIEPTTITNNALPLKRGGTRKINKSNGNTKKVKPSVRKHTRTIVPSSVRRPTTLPVINQQQFFIIPNLTHTTLNNKTILEMDYLESVNPNKIAKIMEKNVSFAITWRNRIYQLFEELKKKGFYHNDTSTQRRNIFFIKLTRVYNKKLEDRYKVGIIDFGQSEMSFNENVRGQPQLDGLPMVQEDIGDFIKWIRGTREINRLDSIYGGTRKKNKKQKPFYSTVSTFTKL